MIRDGKSFEGSRKMTYPLLRYRTMTIMFRPVTKIGKVGLMEIGECVSKRSESMRGSSEIKLLISKRNKLKRSGSPGKNYEKKLIKRNVK